MTAPRQRGFRGTTAYCLDTRWMRGWHEDAEGIVVEVSARRSGGNRFYRVELEAGCDDAGGSLGLQLVSKVGGSMVCGFPGDRAMFSSDLQRSGLAGAFARNAVSHFGRMDADGCAVAQVYPIEPPSTRTGRD